ncbi:MAG: 3-oxoacyl-ACP synthase [Rhodocyclales bacterium]|nr:3-oxoacyl-ACP synthase [Rhodocyclales bacterium]
MLYLNKIVSYLPQTRRSVSDFAEELQLSAPAASLYQKVYGLQDIAVAGSEHLRDMLDRAMSAIVPESETERRQIKYIFHCHAAPCVCPSGADLVGGLKKKYGLQHAIAVGLAQDQCATPITALHLAEILLQDEEENAKVLLLSGETGFHSSLRLIPNTTITGDASAACLLAKNGMRNAVLSIAQRKFEFASVQPVASANLPIPATSYGDDLIQVVKEALARAALSMADIALVLGHNVNTISWKFFARNFPCPSELIYLDNVPKSGHCFTSDPFINYCDVVSAGRLKEGDHFIMVSVGTISTFAAAVVRH